MMNCYRPSHVACALTIAILFVNPTNANAQQGRILSDHIQPLPSSPIKPRVSASLAGSPKPVPPPNPTMPSLGSYQLEVFDHVALKAGATISTWVGNQPNQPVVNEQLAPNYPTLFEIRLIHANPGPMKWYWVVGPGEGWVLESEIEPADVTLSRSYQESRANPGDPAVAIRRGQIELSCKHWVAAIDAFTQALHLDPKNPAIYHDRARAYISGDLDSDPETPDDLASDGPIGPARPVRDYGRALGDLTEELRLAPNSPLAHLERSLVFLLLGERERDSRSKLLAQSLKLRSIPGDDGASAPVMDVAIAAAALAVPMTHDYDTMAAIYRYRAIRDLDRARELGSLIPGIMEQIDAIQKRLDNVNVNYAVSGELPPYGKGSTSQAPVAAAPPSPPPG